jgi:hypothetical protein
MMEESKAKPTYDSPQEREDKADELAQETEDKADKLARQVRRFRWEVRFYYAVLFLFIVGEITNKV